MLLFAAVLLLLATLAAAVAPRRSAPPAPPSSLPAASTNAGTIERRISADARAGTAVRVQRGDVLRLEVTGSMLDSVIVEGLDRMEAIEPLTPAIFDMLAERPGTYPIRLVEADRPIGRLVIRP